MAPQLPQNDTNPQERAENLVAEQEKYRYKYDYNSLPGVAMLDGLPHGELPSIKWVFKAGKTALSILNNLGINAADLIEHELKLLLGGSADIAMLEDLGKKYIPSDEPKRPKSVEEYQEYFKSLALPLIAQNFEEDVIFARMRVAGQNPVVLKKVDKLQENFPINDAIFNSVDGFEDDSLTNAIEEDRLYIVDYVELENVQNGDFGGEQKYSYAPITLFAIPSEESTSAADLMPIAIQCTQEASEDSPIFTPKDGYAWSIAKTIVQIADFNHHELISHLAATHLLIEPFVVTTQRQLAQNHPLKVLLLPHFEGTIFINYNAQKGLVNDGGPFDKLFSGTMPTNREVVGGRLAQSFNDAMLNTNLTSRGVNNEKLVYPYRDDAKSLWSAIHTWVESYLGIYYKNDSDIQEDTELIAWAKELVAGQSEKGGQVVGFGDNNDGEIKTLTYLVDAVTMIIFTGSAQHAAVNFTQRDFSGYTPNMPAAGYTPAPKDKNKQEEDYLDILPPMNKADAQVDLTFLLSGVYYTTLGKYKRHYFKDSQVSAPLNIFKDALEEIEENIEKRNETYGVLPYAYLIPSKIPQSINI